MTIIGIVAFIVIICISLTCLDLHLDNLRCQDKGTYNQNWMWSENQLKCEKCYHNLKEILWRYDELGANFLPIPCDSEDLFPTAIYKYLYCCQNCGTEKTIERISLI